MKYEKVGIGRVLRCYISKVKKFYIEPVNNELKCNCGNIIGIHEGLWIKMKQSAFTYSGTKIK